MKVITSILSFLITVSISSVSVAQSKIEYAFAGELSSMKNIISQPPYDSFLKYVNSSFDAYRLIYPSLINGERIDLSGLILIPKNKETIKDGVFVFSHGTTFSQNVPSNWNHPIHIEALPAMNNYITFLPDYVGYGISSNEVPAYMNKPVTINNINDFIIEGFDALNDLEIPHSDNVYLVGFSQGGHAALSLTEKNSVAESENYKIGATVSIGGPVDINSNFKHIINQDVFPHSGYITYLLASYSYYYQWGSGLSEYLNSPYDSLSTAFKMGTLSLQSLNESTTDTAGLLLKESFRTSFLQEPNSYPQIKNDFRKNSLNPFKTRSPIYFIHGSRDNDVPLGDVETLFKGMSAINPDNVLRLSVLEGLDHNSSGLLGMSMTLDYLNQNFQKE